MSVFLITMIIIVQTFMQISVVINIIGNSNNINKKNIIISFLMFLFQMFLSNFVIPNHLRFVFSIIMFVFVLYFVFKLGILDSLVTGFVSVIFLSLLELIFTFVLLTLEFSQQELMDNIYLKFILNFVIALSSIIVINIKWIKKAIINLKNKILKSKNLVNSCIFILIAIYLIIAKNALFTNSKLDIIINLVILFISLILFIIIFVSDNKNNILQETNKQMLNYVTKYEKIITEQGKANHEFKNQLVVIRGYAQMNSPKLIEYLDSVVEDANKTHSSYLISQLNKFPDGGIKGLLYYKLSIMDDEKIKYEINVENGVKTKLKTLNINMYKNITKILGVLLDNSIDASKNAKDKKIIISVLKNKNIVIFRIYNTYKGNLDISKIGTGYTTKGKGRGFGLKLVKDIINNNKIFNLKNEIKEEYYITNLEVEINSKK